MALEMQTSDIDEIVKRVDKTYNPPRALIGDDVDSRRAWAAKAILTWNELPCDEVIIKAALDGVIYDLASRGRDLEWDPLIVEAKKTDSEFAADLVASKMADRVKNNMAAKDLEKELNNKHEKQYLLSIKKLQLFPGYATLAAWSEIKKCRAYSAPM